MPVANALVKVAGRSAARLLGRQKRSAARAFTKALVQFGGAAAVQAQLRDSLHNLQKATGKDMEASLEWAGALSIAAAIRVTPPYAKFRPGGKLRSNTKSKLDKEVGERAIMRDLFGGKSLGFSGKSRGIITIVPNAVYYQKQLNEDGVYELWTDKRGNTWGAEQRLVTQSMENIREVHEAARSKVTGRVSVAGSRDRRIGRSVFLDRIVTTFDAADRYLGIRNEQVGKTAAGWLPGANALGVKTPRWVKRHRANGLYVKSKKKNGTVLRFRNNTPWILNTRAGQRIIPTALRAANVGIKGYVRRITNPKKPQNLNQPRSIRPRIKPPR
jgi:hypothetical protein